MVVPSVATGISTKGKSVTMVTGSIQTDVPRSVNVLAAATVSFTKVWKPVMTVT